MNANLGFNARKVSCLMMAISAIAQPGIGATEQDLQQAALEGVRILPSLTDPRIKGFDTPHYVYVNREIVVFKKADLPADRRQLLVWLPGTGGKGDQQAGFCRAAANLGYHVITLMYPNDLPASVCANDKELAAFENFRLAIIGGGQTGRISIPRAESIENRLEKLLGYLEEKRPAEKWGQFLDIDGHPLWESIAIGGLSQGGGHAALIGVKHRVARVICAGSPKDYSVALGQPAAWYSDPSATPKARFFSFNHLRDRQGCTPKQQMENLKALGLDQFGPAVNVGREAAPYRHSRILVTDFGPPDIKSLEAHGSVIATRDAGIFTNAWSYLLTEATR